MLGHVTHYVILFIFSIFKDSDEGLLKLTFNPHTCEP